MRGSILILLFFLSVATIHYSRWALSVREEPPAVFRLQPRLLTVGVTDGKGSNCLYQFNDDSTVFDVIKLTNKNLSPNVLSDAQYRQTLKNGEQIKIYSIIDSYVEYERTWLSAHERILLQIPLHPDRMTIHDWEALPGIGLNLARVIEDDRQKNGDFIEFSALDRVKGVGVKKLEAWKGYFEF